MQTEYGEVDYAVGAPNPDFFHGRIYICANCFVEEEHYQVRYNMDSDASEFTGYQFGERFGQTLCAVDINGDGYHDLVVGAPLHALENNPVVKGIFYTGYYYA